MRTVVGGRANDHAAASISEIGRFETETLTIRENLNRLMDLSGQRIDRSHHNRKLTRIVLDMDSPVSETYGQQQGSAFNGHFRMHLLPSPVRLQPVRRPGARHAPAGQPARRQFLAVGAAADLAFFSLDTGIRRVSNAESGEPGEIPDNEANAHLGNPGWNDCAQRIRRTLCGS